MLPTTLEQLLQLRQARVSAITDPATRVLYEYRTTGERSYELCATFDTEENREDEARSPRYDSKERYWAHSSGRNCFALEA